MLVDYTNFSYGQAVNALESGLLRVDSRKVFLSEYAVCLTGFITLKNPSAGNCDSIYVKFRTVTAIPNIGDQRRNQELMRAIKPLSTHNVSLAIFGFCPEMPIYGAGKLLRYWQMTNSMFKVTTNLLFKSGDLAYA
jgi:hypothetical protein